MDPIDPPGGNPFGGLFSSIRARSVPVSSEVTITASSGSYVMSNLFNPTNAGYYISSDSGFWQYIAFLLSFIRPAAFPGQSPGCRQQDGACHLPLRHCCFVHCSVIAPECCGKFCSGIQRRQPDSSRAPAGSPFCSGGTRSATSYAKKNSSAEQPHQASVQSGMS